MIPHNATSKLNVSHQLRGERSFVVTQAPLAPPRTNAPSTPAQTGHAKEILILTLGPPVTRRTNVPGELNAMVWKERSYAGTQTQNVPRTHNVPSTSVHPVS